MAKSTIKKFTNFINDYLYYDAATAGFPVNKKPKTDLQLCLTARNTANGSIYVVWYDKALNGFRIAHTISGSAPEQGQRITVAYEI